MQDEQFDSGHLQPPGTTRTLGRVGGAESVSRTVLPGGLRVLTEPDRHVRSVTIGFWINVGSRDESDSEIGAAHYLEHLLFKGTGKRTAARIAEEIDAVGGELNAFTSKEHTCFYAHVLDSDLPLAIDVLSDIVFDPVNAAEDVDIERGVVLEEIAMRDDDPEDLAHERFASAAFGCHPLGRSVLGTVASIEEMDRDRLDGFHRRAYLASNVVVAVAGNVEHDKVLESLRSSLGEGLTGPTGHVAPTPPRAIGGQVGSGDPISLTTQRCEQAHVLLGYRTFGRYDERKYPLGVLDAALGGGMSSRLFQQVRERRALAYSVYSTTMAHADAGTLSIYAGCQPGRLGETVCVVRDVLAEVAENGLTEAEMRRGRGQLRGGLVLSLEDTGARMSRLGRRELDYGTHIDVEHALSRIDAVTNEEVAEMAAEVLHRPLITAIVGPYADTRELPVELHRDSRPGDRPS